jgi:hypothetical protein
MESIPPSDQKRLKIAPTLGLNPSGQVPPVVPISTNPLPPGVPGVDPFRSKILGLAGRLKALRSLNRHAEAAIIEEEIKNLLSQFKAQTQGGASDQGISGPAPPPPTPTSTNSASVSQSSPALLSGMIPPAIPIPIPQVPLQRTATAAAQEWSGTVSEWCHCMFPLMLNELRFRFFPRSLLVLSTW